MSQVLVMSQVLAMYEWLVGLPIRFH